MIKLDVSNVLPFIGGEEAIIRMEPQVKAAHDMLHKKNGPGSDFLGWLSNLQKVQTPSCFICSRFHSYVVRYSFWLWSNFSTKSQHRFTLR